MDANRIRDDGVERNQMAEDSISSEHDTEVWVS